MTATFNSPGEPKPSFLITPIHRNLALDQSLNRQVRRLVARQNRLLDFGGQESQIDARANVVFWMAFRDGDLLHWFAGFETPQPIMSSAKYFDKFGVWIVGLGARNNLGFNATLSKLE